MRRVQIVNDDGIESPGLKLMEQLARNFTDDVWVVAPEEERSGSGQSISISSPIRVQQRDDRHFAVRGSPADCALLGIYALMGDRRPDILFSGINSGPNLAEDVLYSGTCAAAREGAILGVTAVAFSQMRSYDVPANWQTSERHLPGIIRILLAVEWQPGSFVNVNVPNVSAAEITGTRVTRQGRRPPGGFVPVRRIDERHVPYYWIRIAPQQGELVDGSDLHAVANGAISITPMQLDATSPSMCAELERALAPIAE